MNKPPPNDDQGDDLEALYRKSSAQDPSRPSEKSRQAILEYSARLAMGGIPRGARSSGPIWRRPAFVGSLAAAVLAGLLVGPRFLPPVAPPANVRENSAPTLSAKHLPTPAGPSNSAVATTGEPAPAAARLPEIPPAADVPAPAIQVARQDAAAAPAGADRAVSGSGDATAAAALSESQAKSGAPVVITGMRARRAPIASSSEAGALASPAAGVAESSAPEAARDSLAAVDTRDADGRTPLMVAVLQGRLDAVLVLLRQGADPNATDLAGATPLQAARAKNQPEIADALLRAGAR